MTKPAAWTLMVAVLLLTGCRTTQSLTSDRASTPPVIDGNLEDWAGSLERYRDGTLLVGVKNDGERLFLAVSTSDAGTARQVVITGLELWVDSEGGKKESVGLRFPIGVINYNRANRDAVPLPGGRSDPAMMEMLFGAQMNEIELLARDAAPRRVNVGSIEDVQASSRFEFGTLSMELSIPLGDGQSFGLGVSPDAQILGLGFKTAQLGGGGGGIQRGEGGPPSGGAGGRVGGGGRGGRGGGQGGPGGGPTGAQQPEPIDLWIQLTLAR